MSVYEVPERPKEYSKGLLNVTQDTELSTLGEIHRTFTYCFRFVVLVCNTVL